MNNALASAATRSTGKVTRRGSGGGGPLRQRFNMHWPVQIPLRTSPRPSLFSRWISRASKHVFARCNLVYRDADGRVESMLRQLKKIRWKKYFKIALNDFLNAKTKKTKMGEKIVKVEAQLRSQAVRPHKLCNQIAAQHSYLRN